MCPTQQEEKCGIQQNGAPSPRETAPQFRGQPSPYGVPPAQGPSPSSAPPARGPSPYSAPPAQGPSPSSALPAQGPIPYSTPPAQGPSPYGYPPVQGPSPYGYPPGPGSRSYGYPPGPGPSPYGYSPVQGPSPYGYPPVRGPSPFSISSLLGSSPFGVPGHPPGHYSATWMPAPPAIPNCPPGLEYLTQIDQIIVHQQLELLEIFLNIETNNKYEIKNSMGQRVYFAAEQNDCLTLNCCGTIRPFTMRIFDNMGQVVIELIRPLNCDNCCYPCCLQELEVHAPPGRPIGYVKQLWSPFLPEFVVQNEARQGVLKIVGPCMVCSCMGDVNFDVLSLDQQHVVGRIGKHWTGLLKEFFTDVDNFGIQFPMDLDVKMKAVMLGACFLIDYMFFESPAGSTGQESRGVWNF